MLRQLDGPTWREIMGDAASDHHCLSWSQARAQSLWLNRPRSTAEEPERRSLQALIPAWEAGLTTVVTIPCDGDYTRVVGTSVLVVTEATRPAPDRYAAVLDTFARK